MVKHSHCWLFMAVSFLIFFYDWPTTLGLENFSKKFILNSNGRGQYSFEFQTSDGTYRKEDGGLFPNIHGSNRYAVRGEYHYRDPQGYLHSLKYIADDNGFQPLYNDDYRFNDRRLV